MTINEINRLKEYLTNNNTKFENFIINILLKNSDSYSNLDSLLNSYSNPDTLGIPELTNGETIINIYNKYDVDIHSIIAKNSDSDYIDVIKTTSFSNIKTFKFECFFLSFVYTIQSIKSFVF